MKKKIKKLRLNRETIHFLGRVTGGAHTDNVTICGYTCARLCQPVPTIDDCPTRNLIACNSGSPGCNTGIMPCATYGNTCP